MATARFQKVDESRTCTICTDMYTDPCTLYCQHTFCRKCITKYTKTKPEALRSKTILCPSCGEVSYVQIPSRPVEEWAWQIKPNIDILRFTDTSEPDPNTTEEVKVRRRRKVMCREHEENCIEFHCKDCKKSACQKCCVIYHKACTVVLDSETMRHDLLRKRDGMSKRLQIKSMKVAQKKVDINTAFENKLAIKSQIQSVSQKAIDKIKEKEKQLMDKLDEVTEKQVSQLQADVKTEEMDIRKYKEYCEFIDQAMNSECVMDMFDMYEACESVTLVQADVRNTDTADIRQVKEIRFTQGSDKRFRSLDDLRLGAIYVKFEEKSGVPVYSHTINARMKTDKENPLLVSVTVLVVDNVQTVVVTDEFNKSLKSFYIKNNYSCQSKLSLKPYPHGVTHLTENQVIVTVPKSNKIVTVGVTPDLELLSTIRTNRRYHALAVISPSFLVAGSWSPDNCVDILNMEAHVMKSVSTYNNAELFPLVSSICVNMKGEILVSDSKEKMVTCLTSDCDVLWQQKVEGSTGITTNDNDDILLADGFQKVVQLTETGQFVKDVLTSVNDLRYPRGIFMFRGERLFLCNGGQVKVYFV